MDNKRLEFIIPDSKIRGKSSNQKIKINQAGIYDANDTRYIQFTQKQQVNYLGNKQKELIEQKLKERIFDSRDDKDFKKKFLNVKQNLSNPKPLLGDNENDNYNETDHYTYNKDNKLGKSTSQHVPSGIGCLLCRTKPSLKSIFVNINYVFDKPRFYQMINQQLAQDCTSIKCDCGNKISSYSLKLIKDEIFYTQLMQNQITALRDGDELKGQITKCQSQVCDYFHISEKNKQKNYVQNLKCPICFSNIK